MYSIRMITSGVDWVHPELQWWESEGASAWNDLHDAQ